jgi:trans-AT polyketide synthase/acyltransferase/oxidoreductase domain-containing protein
MGEALFHRFPELVSAANAQLGYSLEELCLRDPDKKLGQTQFTQPALYAVNALSFLAKTEDEKRQPNFTAGHSLGEYNALFAAGAFDFITGLKLVQKRGALMAEVKEGGMAAVIGLSADRINELIYSFAFDRVDVANLNSPKQTVISGPAEDVKAFSVILKEAGAKVIPLNVSGAFHSRMMEPVREQFRAFLDGFRFNDLRIPVIANATAQPYENSKIADLLARQISSSVRWTDTIRYLQSRGPMEFQEVGPGAVLTGLLKQILAEPAPAPAA